MSFEPRDYLRHIVLEADYLIGQTPGLSYEAFVANDTLCRPFVRSLEVIGEAAKKVPEEFRAQPVVWQGVIPLCRLDCCKENVLETPRLTDRTRPDRRISKGVKK